MVGRTRERLEEAVVLTQEVNSVPVKKIGRIFQANPGKGVMSEGHFEIMVKMKVKR